jgi:16S rRNA (cytidine1402-2'-O)-methyltransferase
VSGALVLVATPIGNLGDLSPRATDELTRADVIACEDTRRTRRLLSAAGISAPPLLAVHEHNEAAMALEIAERVGRGERVALVTDAGMPGISDPGERLVRIVAARGLDVSVVPGPSAAVAALAISGLPTARWCFEGFLPRKGRERTERLEAIAGEERTTVLFESPHRLHATLRDLADRCGPARRVVVVRELTKLFEETWRCSLGDAVSRAADPLQPPRGEFVVVIEGAPPPSPAGDAEIAELLAGSLSRGVSRREAVAEVASALRLPRRRVYDVAVQLPTP